MCVTLHEALLSETTRYTTESLVHRKFVWASSSDAGHEVSIFHLPFYSTAYRTTNSGITLNHFSGPHPCTGFHHVFKKKSRKKSATVSLIWPRCWMIGFLFWRASYRHYNHPDLLTLNATIWCNTAIGEPINRQPAWWWCTHIVGFTIDWYACASHLTLQFVPYSIPLFLILTLISR